MHGTITLKSFECMNIMSLTLHRKCSFPLRLSSVNVTKSAGNCGFGHITEKILNGKLYLKTIFDFFVTKYSAHCLFLNPLTTNVHHHIETNQLICTENQLTGFYMMGNNGR